MVAGADAKMRPLRPNCAARLHLSAITACTCGLVLGYWRLSSTRWQVWAGSDFSFAGEYDPVSINPRGDRCADVAGGALLPLPALSSVIQRGASTGNPRYLEHDASANSTVTAAVCLFLRGNEAELDQWVAYYFGLGFSGVYIYDDSPCGDLALWGRSASAVLAAQPHHHRRHQGRHIEVTRWEDQSKRRQLTAYQHCITDHARVSHGVPLPTPSRHTRTHARTHTHVE